MLLPLYAEAGADYHPPSEFVDVLQMIYIVLYVNGDIQLMPVKLEHLPISLQDVYAPFEGKRVTWDHGEIREWMQ